VAAAFGEDDVRTGHQVLDRPGDQDLRRPRQLRHPVGDLHRSAGDVLTDQVHLAGVDPGPDLDPRRGRLLAERGCAADRLPGSVEGGQDAVRGGPDQSAPILPDQILWVPPGQYGLGMQDRGQHAIRFVRNQRAGEEAGDLGIELRAVPACGESQGVIARLLEIPGTGDVRGQITAVAGRRDAVVQALDHQRGDLDRGQHGADVDVADHPRHPQE